MRNLTELQAIAQENIVQTDGLSREQIMDALRDKLGTFDPSMQIDPMKAKDLKNEIDWTASGDARFTKIAKYLTDSYVLEPKLDGARMRLFLGAAKNTMNTGRRSDRDFAYIERSDNFPHIRDAAIECLAGTILDGELMPPSDSIKTASGIVTQGTLNSAVAMVNSSPEVSQKTQAINGKALFYVFDVLALQGTAVTDLSYAERRALLERVVAALQEECPEIHLVPTFEASAAGIDECLTKGFEGSMLKLKTGRYRAGKRSGEWLKVKTMSTADVVIVGSVDGKGRNEGQVGSLTCALYDENGFLVEVCDAGGFTDALRAEITGPNGRVRDDLLHTVIEVMGQCVTKNKRIRHPHFVRFRPDKAATECMLDEQLAPFPVS